MMVVHVRVWVYVCVCVCVNFHTVIIHLLTRNIRIDMVGGLLHIRYYILPLKHCETWKFRSVNDRLLVSMPLLLEALYRKKK